MGCTICKVGLMTDDKRGEPTYMICKDCYNGAQNMISFINKLETENGNANASTSTNSHTGSCKSLSNASKWVVSLTEKQSFLHGTVDAYRNQTPCDILLYAGNNMPGVGAHKALLAARSNNFKNMLESDTCKGLRCETMTLPGMNHEDLEALIEFLYSGSLPQEKLEKHIFTLSVAAHKYEIIYLQKLTQEYMLKSLDSSNALLVLKISNVCSFQTIRDKTLSFIVKHRRDIVFSAEYEDFAAKNPSLSLQITRALSTESMKK